MSSLKDRMAAFQAAANDEGTEKKITPVKKKPGKLSSPYTEAGNAKHLNDKPFTKKVAPAGGAAKKQPSVNKKVPEKKLPEEEKGGKVAEKQVPSTEDEEPRKKVVKKKAATGEDNGSKSPAKKQPSVNKKVSEKKPPDEEKGGEVVKQQAPSTEDGEPRKKVVKKKAATGEDNGSESPAKVASVEEGGSPKSPIKKHPSVESKVKLGENGETTEPKLVTPSPKKSLKKIKAKEVTLDQSAARSKSPIRLSPKTETTSAPPPPKALDLLDGKSANSNAAEGHLHAAIDLLKDKSKKAAVEALINKIDAANGFPKIGRLAVRDNDLVQIMTKVIGHDPGVTEMKVDADVRFEHISKSLVIKFAEAFRSNLHVKTLVIRGVSLGNDFLSTLATSLETNIALTHIDFSRNKFTNEGLNEFCQAMQHNYTCTEVHLQTQHSTVFESAYELVFAALEQNHTLTTLELDFKSEEGSNKLKGILERNQKNPPNLDPDERLLRFLGNEAERAQELWEQRKAEEEMIEVKDDDWDYLYQLSVLFDKYKLQEDETLVEETTQERSTGSPLKKAGDRAPGRSKSAPLEAMLEGMVGFTADGAFLNEEFISKHLKEIPEKEAVIFDFCGQCKLFKVFPATDPSRHTIVTKFVEALLSHPRSKEITGINMAVSCCGNDFFTILAERCLADASHLPNLHLLNAESNYITEPGVVALSKCISSPTTFKYLQVVKLENQNSLMTSKAEFALARAMCVNRSVVVCGLRVRNLLEKYSIDKYIVRNIDFLRQARRHHAIQSGTLQERKRNDMEQLFDNIAANDPSITEVSIVGNQRFKSLNDEEKNKAGASFANNSHVKTVMMSTLQLGDKFAEALGAALASNSTIEKLLLDSNSFGGEGLKALFSGLANNSSIIEMQVRHQSKVTASPDEAVLPDLLEPNKTITKVGIDLRNQLAKMKIDRIINQNREHQRKLRAQAKKSPN